MPDRAGFKKKSSDDGFSYYVYTSQIERLAEGHSAKAIIAALKRVDWLTLDHEGRPSITRRMAGQSSRFYIITPKD